MGMPTVGIFNETMRPFIEFLRSLVIIILRRNASYDAEIVKIGYTAAVIAIFQMVAVRHVGFLEIRNFNGR